jgi:GNAT superfamily N-acetyltransferase
MEAKIDSALRDAMWEALADDPLHVEVRGLLKCSPNVRLLPEPADPQKVRLPSGLLFSSVHGLAIGYGTPTVGLAPSLRRLADESGMARQNVELHLPEATADAWLSDSRVSDLGRNHVQALVESRATERILDLVSHDTSVITDPSDPRLGTLPAGLQHEFASLCPWPVVVAIMAGDRMASIAYAFVETEGYFDVSIDTIHAFRREGYGVSCAAALIRHQLHRGKHPVWIANEKNTASLALSARLGFQDVGRVRRALLH